MIDDKNDRMQKRIAELFEYVQKTDKANIPRLKAFTNFANKHNLKCETIRNLYYTSVKQYKLNNLFKIGKCNHFEEDELKQILQRLVQEINKTHSVRKACYNLSNGDAKLMLRLQNKYRSVLKNEPQLLIEMGLKCDEKTSNKCEKTTNYNTKINVEKTSKNLAKFLDENSLQNAKKHIMGVKNDSIPAKISSIPANFVNFTTDCEVGKKCSKNEKNNNKKTNKNINIFSNISCEIPNKNNVSEGKVLRMPKSQTLSDSDINNLFMGLVKMVKRNALEAAPQNLKMECELANSNLQQTIARLGASTRKLEIIKNENQALKKKLDESQKLLEATRSEFVDLINRIDKTGHIGQLKDFLKKYKSRESSIQTYDN